ncbi:hypothetical protein [Oerskovia turbata]
MSNGGIRTIIEAQAEALGPVLYAGMATSLVTSSTRRAGLSHAKYPHVLPQLLRCEMREHLEKEGVPPGWSVGGDPRKMGQLTLGHEGHNLELRFLKERRRTYPGGVPIAGRNASRRGKWINQELDLQVPHSAAPDQEPYSLLLLWDFIGAGLDKFSLRIVHTLEPGVYGKEVPCDLILEVEHGGSIFSRLSFGGDPENHDLFEGNTIQLDEGEHIGN